MPYSSRCEFGWTFRARGACSASAVFFVLAFYAFRMGMLQVYVVKLCSFECRIALSVFVRVVLVQTIWVTNDVAQSVRRMLNALESRTRSECGHV